MIRALSLILVAVAYLGCVVPLDCRQRRMTIYNNVNRPLDVSIESKTFSKTLTVTEPSTVVEFNDEESTSAYSVKARYAYAGDWNNPYGVTYVGDPGCPYYNTYPYQPPYYRPATNTQADTPDMEAAESSEDTILLINAGVGEHAQDLIISSK